MYYKKQQTLTMSNTKVLLFDETALSSLESIDRTLDTINNVSTNENTAFIIFTAFGKDKDKVSITGLLAELIDKSTNNIQYDQTLKAIYERFMQIINHLFVDELEIDMLSAFELRFQELKLSLKTFETSADSKQVVINFGTVLSSYLLQNKLKTILKCNIISDNIISKLEHNYINKVADSDNPLVNLPALYNIHIVDGKFITKFDTDIEVKHNTPYYYASIITASTDAESLTIYSNKGLYTCNPKIVPKAFLIEKLSYKEAINFPHYDMSDFNIKIFAPVLKKKIPIALKNIFDAYDKNTIVNQFCDKGNYDIRGISNMNHIVLLNIEANDLAQIPNFSNRIFSTLDKSNIIVPFIAKKSLNQSITIAITSNQLEWCLTVLNIEFQSEINTKLMHAIEVKKNLSFITIIGTQTSVKSVSTKIFNTLNNNNIKVLAFSQGISDTGFSLIINAKDLKTALNKLHATFFENPHRTINMFIAGIGNVGKTLIKQMVDQDNWLYEEKHIDLNIFAIANQKEMIFDYGGIRISQMDKSTKHAEPMNITKFIEKTVSLGYPNSVFVDNTSNRTLALSYHKFLENGISVVTPNKTAFSEDLAYYKKIKKTAIDNDVSLLYSATISAGLPIIKTIKSILYTGDKITKIEAVLSGSLNYIFSKYDTKISFASVVKEAEEKGYTEPDPRIDLSGIDVLRKMLIIAREANFSLESKDIDLVHFLPTKCIGTASVDDFYKKLEEEEEFFVQMYNKARVAGAKLQFVSIFEKGEYQDVKRIELLRVRKSHPLYGVQGNDNSIMIYTNRYGDRPITISGAGAGKEVTAMSVFADILDLAK